MIRWAALLSLGLLACGSGGAPSQPVSGDTDWGPCSAGFRDQCRILMMPLDRAASAGPRIPVAVSRAPALAEHRGDVWLIAGGPGQSAAAFELFVDQVRAAAPGLDVYTIEHRGVGQSARLTCPVQESPSSPGGAEITEAELPDCLAALQARPDRDLQHFRLTPAAQDLAEAIERTRTPGLSVFVYGVSYGTTVAIRYLQLHPDDPTAVIVDSVAPAGLQFFDRFQTQWDPVLHRLADLCVLTLPCGSHFGPDIWQDLAPIAHAASGECPYAMLSPTDLSAAVQLLLESATDRSVALPLLRRIKRCNSVDVIRLDAFRRTIANSPLAVSRISAPLLYLNVVFSDLWQSPPPSVDELTSTCDAQALCDQSSSAQARLRLLWPAFPRDPLGDSWPLTTSRPVLVLNGELDPQTPIESANAFVERLSSPHLTYVKFPYGTHGAAFQTLAQNPDEVTCGFQILTSFLQNPEAPDTSCVSGGLRPSFGPAPELSRAWFGAEDLWDQ